MTYPPCPRCRTPLPPGAPFCTNCGYQTASSPGVAVAVPVAPAGPPQTRVGESVAAAPAPAPIRRGLFVEDLGSTNGTYVNGQRITRQNITFSDDVRLGSAPVPLSDPRIAGLVAVLADTSQRPVGRASATSRDATRDTCRFWAH